MAKKRKKRNAIPPEVTQRTSDKRDSPVRRRRKTPLILWWVVGIAALFVIVSAAQHAERLLDRLDQWVNPPLARAEIQRQGLIVDVHEHIGSADLAQMYLDVMDEMGIRTMCLMGSSKFTLTLDESYGFTEYDENNEELMKILEMYPGRFEAWPTVSPTDPDKLEKFKALVDRGATGLKLYTGHGYVTKKREYMFHPVAMDDPGMLPLYAYCEENFIPVCLHVNPFDDGSHKGKPGFAEEIHAVLTQFPDLKFDLPHFILSSVRDSRLQEFLDTFPNVYSNISFGDFFMKERLLYISEHPDKFRALFDKYPDRFMFASDLVLIKSPRQNRKWISDQLNAYLDMLTEKTYTTDAIPGEVLNGLALRDELVENVLYKNYERLKNDKPQGTKITRTFQWSRTGIKRTGREPGEHFPPRPLPAKTK